MSNTVISVENLSKSYRLGQISTGTLSHDINVWWARLRGKPNPVLKMNKVDTTRMVGEYIWALKDVSFSVEQGDVLGIIGRNGAGKSTLLKILSEVTAPTSGEVKVKGRIASLLEVGTGFHPDLTGRENTYLNGAILGMSRAEITRKFDEIVDFSGVEKFIDTPVKRFSSGMYVRLAFAVAAHLEPEILVVDEVLAVGDAEFQRKCLGKMGAVAKEGRTVLLVSHLMTAIRSLCQNVILLDNGSIAMAGEAEEVLEEYLHSQSSNVSAREWTDPSEAAGNDLVRIKRIWVNVPGKEDGSVIYRSSPLQVGVEYWNLGGVDLDINLQFFVEGNIVAFSSGTNLSARKLKTTGKTGLFRSVCEIPPNFLNSRNYQIRLLVMRDNGKPIFKLNNVLAFDVLDDEKRELGWFGKDPGVLHPALAWKTQPVTGNENQ